jgi:hypothetical protein
MDTAIERTLSDVLRTPNPVLEEAERRDVLIRRRGQAGDMMLMEAKRARALRDTLGTFARLMHAAAQIEGVEGHLTRDVSVALPWTSLLPEEERHQFVIELMEMAGASADTGNYGPLARLLRDWQATANVYADPAAFKELTEPLEETELPSLLPKPAKRGGSRAASADVTTSSSARKGRRPTAAEALRKQQKAPTTAAEALRKQQKAAGRTTRAKGKRAASPSTREPVAR